MQMDERQWDKLLRIKTTGRDDSRSDAYHYPYEPTPYEVLERIAATGYLTKVNTLVDYGCGKGRVDFYLSYQTKCRSIGVEFNPRIYEQALANMETGASAGRVSFVWENAELYTVEPEADRFYFFNPFSVEVFQKVMGRIRDSWYENPRQMLLFFYYPSDEYVAYLMTQNDLSLIDELDCRDLFNGLKEREHVLIFELSY